MLVAAESLAQRPLAKLVAHPSTSPYQQNLGKNPANYAPLTPISFLERTADVFPDRTAWIHGNARASYAEFRARCRRLASALARRGALMTSWRSCRTGPCLKIRDSSRSWKAAASAPGYG